MTSDDRTREPDSVVPGSTPPVDPVTGSGSTAVPAEVRHDTRRRKLPVWQESILLLALAVVLAIVLKAFVVQAFYIPSASMEPGLVNDDRIVVQKVSSWFGGEPQRGDVVVFEDPGGWLGPNEEESTGGATSLLSRIGLYPEGGHLVKRVVGVAGDTVVCCDAQGRITVNDVSIDGEDYAPRGKTAACDGPMIGDCSWSAGPVPEGSIFVMGDNRDQSADSTVHICLDTATDCTDTPFVDTDLVVGTVFGVVWPLGNSGLVGRPDGFEDVPDRE